MNRNIDKAVETVFNIIQLKFNLKENDFLPSEFYTKRYISGDKEDNEWLKRTEVIANAEIGHGNYFAILRFNNLNYFVSIGGQDYDLTIPGFNPVPNNAGLFTALIYELEIPVKHDISLGYLEEHIISQHVNIELYTGHNYKELLKIFPNFYIYEILPEYIGDNSNLFQSIAHYLTTTGLFIPLPLSMNTRSSLNDLVLVGSNILDYESIVQSLFSSSWKFAFLDLYRCIEMLYQLIYVDELYNHLNLTLDKTTLLESLDSKLKWKPTERNSINKLLNETPDLVKSRLRKEIKKIQPKLSQHADWLYDLRCNIVHLKKLHNKIELSSNNWDGIMHGVSNILLHWYNHYKIY